MNRTFLVLSHIENVIITFAKAVHNKVMYLCDTVALKLYIYQNQIGLKIHISLSLWQNVP